MCGNACKFLLEFYTEKNFELRNINVLPSTFRRTLSAATGAENRDSFFRRKLNHFSSF